MPLETPTFIQAVPWERERAVLAAKLRLQTGGTVIWDEEHSGLATWMKVLEAMGEGAGILLEDDVILTSNWRQKIETVISHHPRSIIRFWSDLEADVTEGSRWKPGKTFFANLCVYYPPTYARQQLEWCRKRSLKSWNKLHDHVTGLWLDSRGEDYWLQVPSLVQHRGDLKSVAAPRRPLGRVSRTFETEAAQ
ncbi:hypothetical protein HOT31_gp154 [Microbacterium phage Hendrix]|uniref:Glycosyltransferase n=1 Tax=Microbacterium phage Hendrix TaxID=2182341 RepID=A0A2U8UUF1_9CAUD|nr:hypothetical protein HOT31_gp154 [Microbacterium phage Hendrix]AWN07821.1 hypothetical protein PBI_HENDRIX_154 [Microbacterium phage Hendrix]